MKLNFWQWVGILLVVIGAIGYLVLKGGKPAAVPTTPTPATQSAP